MPDHAHGGAGLATGDLLVALFAGAALLAYGLGVAVTRDRGWPAHRSAAWLLGVLAAALSVAGPLAERAHGDFVAHMVAHLLLGMLAPLLLVWAAPVTLALRALPVRTARRVPRVLGRWPVRVVTEPVVAAALNVGGVWLLYTTPLYAATHTSTPLHVAVHAHVFLAGWAFTIAIVSVDPLPHRRSYVHRAVVLVLATAGHAILAKLVYARPPLGVPTDQAETAGMLMYYGGDLVEVTLAVLLCARWYRATRPRPAQLLAEPT